MDFNKLVLYFHTLKYLEPIQVFYRVYYRFTKRHCSYNPASFSKPSNSFSYSGGLKSPQVFEKKNYTFTFLNLKKSFPDNRIDWNCKDYGKLWTYNLNYFDFLNQDKLSKNEGLRLINNFIDYSPNHIDGMEPYPISLRVINWIKFISKHNIQDPRINNFLYKDCNYLSKNIEYHLLGNHILENAFSLLFAAYYFDKVKLYKKSKSLIVSQLDEQILNDGAHFELSPMYHKIILHKLLDIINLNKINSHWPDKDFLLFLTSKAESMCSWLERIKFKSGYIPMVNDATFDIAPTAESLLEYADNLGIKTSKIDLSDSGYRKIDFSNYELIVDVGNIGPDYQPGHAHSDTFNFEIHVNQLPVIVDTGITTYEKNEVRQLERSTSSHNTVMIGDYEQSEVWGGFRVGRRAKITDLNEKSNHISAKHNGYSRIGISHKRSFDWSEKRIVINDKLSKSSKNRARAFFHFHSDVLKPKVLSDRVQLLDKNIEIIFKGHSNINLLTYNLSQGFNKTIKAHKIEINFDKDLNTQINL